LTVSGSILIVDDENSLRTMLARVLRQAGWEVTTAADGQTALNLLGDTRFDLIYLDIHLSEMTGLKVLEAARRSYPELPVVLFTGQASLATSLEALRLGATDYLIKPIDPEVLIARTRVILEERAVERRRREIREQIEILQTELKSLEQSASSAAALKTVSGERFIKRGRLVLDLQARRATFGERVLALTPTSFDYLLVLTRHAPEVVDYRTLAVEAQGYQTSSLEAKEIAKWHIHSLRQSLELDPARPRHILNVRGSGYRLLLD